MSILTPPFPRVQIAQLEGRTQSTLYKQAQFQSLHRALIESTSTIKLAIQADSGHTPTEVDLEYTLALSELKTLYQSLDLAKELETHRVVPSRKDNPHRKQPVGIVYIVPTKWCLFYSVMSPLGAAIAAGNGIVLELPQTLSQISSVLRKVLVESLDGDIFAISTSRPAAADFTRECTLVLQEEEVTDHSRWQQVLQSPSSSFSVAVVDRTADIVKAAEAIASTSFAFRGRSPYSSCVVLANEFVADQLLSALIAHVVDSSPGASTEKLKIDGRAGTPKGEYSSMNGYGSKVGVRHVVSGSNGSIVEVLNRDSPLLLKGLDGPTIVVHRVSSLDDAININFGTKPLAACFAFGGLEEANYVSTFINAYLSTINHIPAELLIGPIAPLHPCQPPTASPRYSPSMFVQPKPQYLHSASGFDPALLAQKREVLQLKKWSQEVMKPFPEIRRKSGFHLNFFGTGILISLTTVLATSTGACWFLYKKYRGQ